jgi:hypothetical protein
MNPLTLAASIGACILAAGLIGLFLQSRLPETYTTGGARDMLGAVAGLLTLLCALVLGLLIWTAYGVYAGQNLALQSLAGKVLQLDRALADYGPDASPVREKLKASVASTISEVWGSAQTDATFVARNLDAAMRNMRVREQAFAALHPQTDEQKASLAEAKSIAESIAQSRLQMALALTNPISLPLLFTVATWAGLIFLGYGLTSKAHVMTVIAAVLGVCAITSAFFLILDLSVPYDGVFHVSPAPLEDVMKVMGRAPGQG